MASLSFAESQPPVNDEEEHPSLQEDEIFHGQLFVSFFFDIRHDIGINKIKELPDVNRTV